MTNEQEPVSEMDLEQLTALFRLLSDKTRLNVLLLLSSGERNVSWLCRELKLPQPTVSHHLGLLRISNVIANRRDGKQVFYQLNGRLDHAEPGALAIHTEHFIVSIRRSDQKISIEPQLQPSE